MFPELGALSHDVFTRPRGTWARSLLMLAITPFLTAVIGIVFTRALPYGFVSVLLTVGSSIALIMMLKSPIAPAISAGLLPLVLGVKSWWYPPGVLLGTVLLCALSILWERISVAQNWLEPLTAVDVVDETLEQNPATSYWLIALILFVAMAVLVVKLTGLRFVLFPPLVVIGFEMFGHTADLPVGQAATVSSGRLFSNRRRWIALLESARCRTGGRRMQYRNWNGGAALVRFARTAGARSRSASIRDGLADHRLPNLGRNRNDADDAMVSTLPIVLSQIRARVSLAQRSLNSNEHQSYRPGVRDAGRSRDEQRIVRAQRHDLLFLRAPLSREIQERS